MSLCIIRKGARWGVVYFMSYVASGQREWEAMLDLD